MSICNLGIMGTEYIFENDTPPLTTEVDYRQTSTLNVSKIKSALPIGNTIDSQVRQKQGTELSWVTFDHSGSEVKIKFSPQISQTPKTYTLNLEYFDSNSSVKSCLKSHTLSVLVKADIVRDTTLPASFEVIARQPDELSIGSVRTEPESKSINLETR